MSANDEFRRTREYSRVDAFLPLHVRIVPPEERKSIRSRMSREAVGGCSQPLPDLDDSALAECLKIINNKLDAILSALNLREKEQQCFHSRKANISGSGISFDSEELYAHGDLVEIKLMLPNLSEAIVYVMYGEIVRVEEDPGGSRTTSIKFTEIDEDIRERIVKFVFEKQRELLRKQRRL